MMVVVVAAVTVLALVSEGVGSIVGDYVYWTAGAYWTAAVDAYSPGAYSPGAYSTGAYPPVAYCWHWKHTRASAACAPAVPA